MVSLLLFWRAEDHPLSLISEGAPRRARSPATPEIFLPTARPVSSLRAPSSRFIRPRLVREPAFQTLPGATTFGASWLGFVNQKSTAPAGLSRFFGERNGRKPHRITAFRPPGGTRGAILGASRFRASFCRSRATEFCDRAEFARPSTESRAADFCGAIDVTEFSRPAPAGVSPRPRGRRPTPRAGPRPTTLRLERQVERLRVGARRHGGSVSYRPKNVLRCKIVLPCWVLGPSKSIQIGPHREWQKTRVSLVCFCLYGILHANERP